MVIAKSVQSSMPSSARSHIESKFEDISLLLNSCHPFLAMHGIKNLSSDLRAEVDTRKNINHEEYTNYQQRLEKMILEAEKTCKCKVIKEMAKAANKNK